MIHSLKFNRYVERDWNALYVFKLMFIQTSQFLGVPLEGKVRVQLNLKVDQAPHIQAVKDFRNIVFPIMWVEEVS